MRVPTDRLLAAVLLVCAGTASTAVASPWPSVPSRLELDTPYGSLRVSASDYVYESRLLLDGQLIEPRVEGRLNIPYAFSTPRFHLALVSVSSGDRKCPIRYQWVRLDKRGYSVTPAFGSCSDQLNVVVERGRFTLTTPNAQNPDKVDTYIYDGKTVSEKAAR